MDPKQYVDPKQYEDERPIGPIKSTSELEIMDRTTDGTVFLIKPDDEGYEFEIHLELNNRHKVYVVTIDDDWEMISDG